ncbi:MAG: UDP-N-acetylglucosamine 2-epimerase (non-hydrolyzing) [Gemmatimonadaceae bacterium]|nr:UDP-N-acetylglucosamine 2-epimerase (non-hydrolyzing) [Gemmatimonadaceae bacterium]
MRILHIVGARPNFPKLAPVYRAAHARGVEQVIVHTGQHYTESMSGGFFADLGIPTPDVHLEVGSGTHAVQTARAMERLEPVLHEQQPRWVVVYGDVNSTLAGALVAAKLRLPIAHVEAGLRSGDSAMPEEINRIVTDRLASLLLTPSRGADATLLAEGEPEHEIVFVGNVMIDSLRYALPTARARNFVGTLDLQQPPVVVTLHRPSNVDDPSRLARLASALAEVAQTHPVVFPVHPRTRAALDASGADLRRVRLLDPVGYYEMLSLLDDAHAVVTDSGGLQEESTALNVPCFTVRENTERPITITEGTNRLVTDLGRLGQDVRDAVRPATTRMPEGWDGRAGERIADALVARP